MVRDSRDALEIIFPGLKGTRYHVTSPRDGRYNCIALAAGDQMRWWWPIPSRYWPDGAPREVTVAAFEQAFGALGYKRCADGSVEPDADKVALFVDDTGEPTHMARQRKDLWHSKLGDLSDIVHELHALEGDAYGRVHSFYARTSKNKRDAKEQRKAARG